MAVVLLAAPRWATAQLLLPPDPSKTAGKRIDLARFVDESGTPFEAIRSATPAEGRGVPWVVSPIYTRCRSTCSPLTAMLKHVLADPSLDRRTYRVLSFSFDRDERPEGLGAFRERMQLPAEWLTLRATDPATLDAALATLDFRTLALADGQLDHPNLVAVLTPDMRISEYLLGLDFTPRQMADALDRARAGGAARRPWRALLFVLAALGFTASAFVFASQVVRVRRTRA